MSDNYMLTLKGPGITLDKEVSQESALQIIALVLGARPVASGAELGTLPVPPRSIPDGSVDCNRAPSIPPISIREYLDEKGVARNPEKILAIGAYLTDTLNQSTFSRQSILGQFKNAGEPSPANYPRDFKLTVQNGWIASDPSDNNSYYITKKGRDALDNNFSPETRKAFRRPRVARKKNNKNTEQGTDASTLQLLDE